MDKNELLLFRVPFWFHFKELCGIKCVNVKLVEVAYYFCLQLSTLIYMTWFCLWNMKQSLLLRLFYVTWIFYKRLSNSSREKKHERQKDAIILILLKSFTVQYDTTAASWTLFIWSKCGHNVNLTTLNTHLNKILHNI